MLGFIWIIIFWAEVFLIFRIKETFQFKDVSVFSVAILYLTPIILLGVLIYCLIRYLNIPKTKILKSFAKPLNYEISDQQIITIDNNYKKTRILIGFIIGLMSIMSLLFVSYMVTYDNSQSQYNNLNRDVIQHNAEFNLNVFAKKVRDFFDKQNSKNQLINYNSDWQCIFTSDLPIFETEKKVYDELHLEHKQIIESFESDNPGTNLSMGDIVILVWEFQLDKDKTGQFKLRYNMSKQVNYTYRASCFEYNAKKEIFERKISGRNFYTNNTEIPITYVYDSQSDSFRFQYDSFIDNFLEHYKFVLYILIYAFTLLMCFILIKFSEKTKSKNKVVYGSTH